MKKLTIILSTALLYSFFISGTAHSGPYANDLSKCLISSTTVEDRNLLVNWIFAAAAIHPAVKSIATVTPAQLEESNKGVATLFMRLLTKSCINEAKDAVKYEGESTLTASFNVLGQIAGRELFADPNVAKNMAALDKYFDKQKLDKALSK